MVSVRGYWRKTKHGHHYVRGHYRCVKPKVSLEGRRVRTAIGTGTVVEEWKDGSDLLTIEFNHYGEKKYDTYHRERVEAVKKR